MKSFVTREREHRRHIQVCVFTVINFALLNDFKSYLTASRPIKRQSGLICVMGFVIPITISLHRAQRSGEKLCACRTREIITVSQ